MRDELERLAGRLEAADTNDTDCLQAAELLRALAARFDQPVGEPVPLPDAFAHVDCEGSKVTSCAELVWPRQVRAGSRGAKAAWRELSPGLHPLYTADQLREYAETVAAPLRKACAQMMSDAMAAKLDKETAELKLLTAEGERDKARASRDFYTRRCDMLQAEQKRMRDPERTLVCDIPANGQLLPDPHGKRYGPIDSAMADDKHTTVADVSDTTARLIRMIRQRDAAGLAKYGTTLDRTDLTHAEWLQHMAEELLDGAGYALAAIRTISDGKRGRTTGAEDVAAFRKIVGGKDGQ